MVREARCKPAILDAEVVGSGQPAARLDHVWTARLVQDRVERLAPAVARHGGRLVKRGHAGARAEFPNAAGALGAAIEFQQAMANANFGQSKDNAVVFRLGLHLGPVEERALREAHKQARAGAIVVSAPLRDTVAGRVKASFAELGSTGLGTVERPVHAYEVGWDPADWPAQSAAAAMPVTGRSGDRQPGGWLSVMAWALLLIAVLYLAWTPRSQPRPAASPVPDVESFDPRLHESQAEAAMARWQPGRGEPDEPDDEPANPDGAPADAYDGVYVGALTTRGEGSVVTFRLKVTNGVGAGTQSRLDCGTAPMALKISQAGDVSGMVLIFGATCLKTELAVRGRAVGSLLQLRLGSQYLELGKSGD
jgi:class 3 adenylate cyclase